MLEQADNRDFGMGLVGDERPIEGGEREPGEDDRPPRHRASKPNTIRICVRRRTSAMSRTAIDDSVDLTLSRVDGLSCHHDENPQKVGMALERRCGGGRSSARRCRPVKRLAAPYVRQGLEEALGAALHDGEQDPVLGAEVVVDGAERDARLLHDAGEGRRLEAVLAP